MRGRLLIAEDNAVNQQVARALLEQSGFSVDVVGDGQAAVAAVASGDYDAVLMDCQMPIMDGFEATKAIREHEREGDRMPIIALSAAALESDRERCFAAGMDDHVAKPLRLEALLDALDRLVGTRSRERRQTVQPAAEGPLDPVILGQLHQLSRNGSPNLLRDLHVVFVEDAREGLGSLRAAAAARDVGELQARAHKLKGSAGSVGATAMGDLCRRIEEEADAGDFDDLERVLSELESEITEVVAALARAAQDEASATRAA
jgi:CheY-like chemotaxis protein/HPt (histidine-containing phosphotransfer) domain-containing protein